MITLDNISSQRYCIVISITLLSPLPSYITLIPPVKFSLIIILAKYITIILLVMYSLIILHVKYTTTIPLIKVSLAGEFNF